MRAACFERHGGPEEVRVVRVEPPRPGPGEALVRVRAVALNHLDVWLRRGLPRLRVPLPHVGGADVCGELIELGAQAPAWAGPGPRIGQRVLVNPVLACGRCALCQGGRDNLCAAGGLLGESRWGGLAELVVVPAANLVPLPNALEDTTWAALPVTYMTAWHMLVDRAGLRPGESVLIWAAGSGVGMAAVQIARLLCARVLVTASTEVKRERLRAAGVEVVLDPADPALVDQVRAHTGGAGADVVFEHTGAATFAASVRAAARGGRIVTCGATSGHRAELDLRHVFWRQLSILGVTLAPRGCLHELVAHVAAGRLRPQVDRVLPLEACAEAHALLEARVPVGKLVVVPRGGGAPAIP